MAEKRYWWLKLPETFFQQKEIRALQRRENGAVLVLIYIKMQLSSLQTGGVLFFDGYEDSFAEELAFQIDEDPEDIQKVMDFLKKHGLLLEKSEKEIYFPAVIESTGTEGSSAKRVRNYRKKRQPLQCNDSSDDSALQCNAKASQNDDYSLLCHGEKELDIELEKKKELEEETDIENTCAEPLQVSPPEPEEPPVISFILNDKSRYPIRQAQVNEWSGLYPAVDIMQELRKMAGWLDANPNKRKTARGILRFVNGWLAREQDKGGSKKQAASPEQETSFDLDEYERSTGWGYFAKAENTTAQQSCSSGTVGRLEGQDENGFRVYEV